MIITDFHFWLVAIILYLLDQLVLIETNEMLVHEDISNRLWGYLNPIPFIFKGKCLICLNPITPFFAVFKFKWMLQCNSDNIDSDYNDICEFQKNLDFARILVLIGFSNIFIAGPILTYQIGLGHSLLYIFPAHYVVSILLFFNLHKKFFFIPHQIWIKWIFECVACPVYLPNLLRRISLLYDMNSDGIIFVLRHGSESHDHDLVQSAITRVEDLIEIADQENSVEYFNDYLSEIRK